MSAPATAATALPVASPVTRSSAALSRSEEHTSELQSQSNLVCRLLLEKKNTTQTNMNLTCAISRAWLDILADLLMDTRSLLSHSTTSLHRIADNHIHDMREINVLQLLL